LAKPSKKLVYNSNEIKEDVDFCTLLKELAADPEFYILWWNYISAMATASEGIRATLPLVRDLIIKKYNKKLFQIKKSIF